jgi:hypothetical protein
MKIPKKVFYTFYTKKIWETEIGKHIEIDLNNNPEFSFELYDDEDCVSLIQEHFDERVMIAFQQLLPGAYKADLVRLLLLYVYGGVYMDVGLTLAVPLKDIIQEHELVQVDDLVLRLEGHGGHPSIYNAFMASIPKHPYIRECIDMIVYKIHNLDYGMSCWDITGPHIMGSVFKKYYPLEEGIYDNGKIKIVSFKKFGKEDIFFEDQLIINGKKRMEKRNEIVSSMENNIDSKCNHYTYLYGLKKIFHCLSFGSWFNSARNYRIHNGKIFAELRNCRGQWILDSAPIDKNQQYKNIDGKFVLQI